MTTTHPDTSKGEGDADETGWLIELRGDGPKWWSLDHSPEPDWTQDANRALRFARKADADAYIADIGWTEAFATEHEWPALRPHDWFEFKGMKCCRSCGCVWNATSDRRSCKGPVKVGLRSTPSAGGLGTVKALDQDERMLLGWMLAAFEQSKVGWKITDDLKREMRAANRLVARLSSLDRTSLPPTEGMVMVPKEPSLAMINAAVAEATEARHEPRSAEQELDAAWSAMLAAAPQGGR